MQDPELQPQPALSSAIPPTPLWCTVLLLLWQAANWTWARTGHLSRVTRAPFHSQIYAYLQRPCFEYVNCCPVHKAKSRGEGLSKLKTKRNRHAGKTPRRIVSALMFFSHHLFLLLPIELVLCLARKDQEALMRQGCRKNEGWVRTACWRIFRCKISLGWGSKSLIFIKESDHPGPEGTRLLWS